MSNNFQNENKSGSSFQNTEGYFLFLHELWQDVSKARRDVMQLTVPEKYDALELLYEYQKQLYRCVRYYLKKKEIEQVEEIVAKIEGLTKNVEFSQASLTSANIVEIRHSIEKLDTILWDALGSNGLLPKKSYENGLVW